MVRAVLISAVTASVLTVLVINLFSVERRIAQKISHLYGTNDPQFLRELGVLLGPPVVYGNRVINLENGDAIFAAMLAAIRGAERTITFETYIYWSGTIGQAFADALSERARAGVKVHVLVEANLNIYQRAFAERVTAVFEEDLQQTDRITLEQWRNRPVSDQVTEAVSALFSSQL